MTWDWFKEHWGRLVIVGSILVAVSSFVGSYLAVDLNDWMPVSGRRLNSTLTDIKKDLREGRIETIETRKEVWAGRKGSIEKEIDELERRLREKPDAFWIKRKIDEHKANIEFINREISKLESKKTKLEDND